MDLPLGLELCMHLLFRDEGLGRNAICTIPYFRGLVDKPSVRA